MRVRFEGVVFVEQVRKGTKQVVKEAKIIVAVPNVWMQLPIIDMLLLVREGYIQVNSLSELNEKVKEYPRSILVIDIFAYEENYRDIMARLKKESPFLYLVALLSKDNLAYGRYLEGYGSCLIVETEKADKMLLSTIGKARQDQKLEVARLLLEEQKQLLVPTVNKKEVNLMEKEEANILRRKIGRRSFLKGSAAAAVVAGVVVASPGSAALQALAVGDDTKTAGSEEQIFVGVCRSPCLGGCQMNVHVRDGKIVKTSKRDYPDTEWNRVCTKGLSHAQRTYDEKRLKYPMRRVGERGADKWEQLSWDEAIKYICDKWKGYRAEFGNTSICYAFGGGNLGLDSHNYYKRLFNLMGSTWLYHSYDTAATDIGGRAIGYGPWFFGNSYGDMSNSKYIFVWGANPTSSYNANWWFMQRAAENGAKRIVIDPTYTCTASKADRFVPIKPATDAALAMAMINIVVKEGLADKTYIANATVGPFLVKESDGLYLRQSDLNGTSGKADAKDNPIVVRGADGKVGLPSEIPDPVINGTYEINGIKVTTAYDLLLKRTAEWTPEKASALCDIPVDTIYELARMYADGPTCLYTSYGIDHFGNGSSAYLAMFALAMVTGQMGKPGAGVGGANSMPLGFGIDCTPIIMPKGAVPGPQIPSVKLLDILNEGKYGATPMNIKSIYINTTNLLRTQTQRTSWIETFNKLDLVVVADTVMSDTARHADIVLPVSGYFEYETALAMCTPYAELSEKAIDPLYQSKPDFDIINLLGQGMGFADFAVTREEFFTRTFDNDFCKAAGISWEKLKKEKTMRYLPDEYVHGAGGKFPTATGRAQFYLEGFKPYANFGQAYDPKKESLPYWEPPIEAWHENPLFSKYPLIFTSERGRFKAHTGFTHCQWLLELMSEPFVMMNPQDAAARGIVQGDTIKAFNDRGYVVLKANVSAGTRPGMIVINHGWEHDQYIDGDYTDLTSRKFNPSVPNNAYFDVLCEVKKM